MYSIIFIIQLCIIIFIIIKFCVFDKRETNIQKVKFDHISSRCKTNLLNLFRKKQ
jgi:hypothetical protein